MSSPLFEAEVRYFSCGGALHGGAGHKAQAHPVPGRERFRLARRGESARLGPLPYPLPRFFSHVRTMTKNATLATIPAALTASPCQRYG